MPILSTTYESSDTPLTISDGTLAADARTTSAIYTNGTTGSASFVDVFVGGTVTMGTTPLVGETVNIYIAAQHTMATATTMTGGISTLFAANDAAAVTEGTEFAQGNLKLFDVVSMETTTPADDNAYQWGPVSVAAAFGGSMPKQFMLMFDNQTAGTTTAITINTYGIQYTST